jgi:hypothetical protein
MVKYTAKERMGLVYTTHVRVYAHIFSRDELRAAKSTWCKLSYLGG